MPAWDSSMLLSNAFSRAETLEYGHFRETFGVPGRCVTTVRRAGDNGVYAELFAPLLRFLETFHFPKKYFPKFSNFFKKSKL